MAKRLKSWPEISRLQPDKHMTLVTDIKTEVKIALDALVSGGVIKEVQHDDFRVGIFDRDYAKFPVAILTTPSIEGEYLTNRQNTRVHTFEIIILMRGEDVGSPADVENLMETILDKFDNNLTLTAKADGGVEPSITSPEVVIARSKSFITFSVIVKAKAVKDLTF